MEIKLNLPGVTGKDVSELQNFIEKKLEKEYKSIGLEKEIENFFFYNWRQFIIDTTYADYEFGRLNYKQLNEFYANAILYVLKARKSIPFLFFGTRAKCMRIINGLTKRIYELSIKAQA